MADKRCPECSSLVEIGTAQCSCGHVFPVDSKIGWADDLGEMHFPSTASAWLVIAGAFPVTLALYSFLAWLGWFNLDHLTSVINLGLFLFVGVAQLMPNLRRKGGGCCMGCLTWMSVGAAIWLASGWYTFDVSPADHEVKPLARYHKDIPVTVDGVRLGEARQAVAKSKGEGVEVEFPFVRERDSLTVRYGERTLVTYADDLVVCLQGQALVQEDRELVALGQPRSRLRHLFDTSSYAVPRLMYRVGDMVFTFSSSGGTLSHIVVAAADQELVLSPPSVTLDHIVLGSRPSEPAAGARVDDFGRVTSAEGNVLRRGDEVLLQAGDPITRVTKLLGRQFQRPVLLGGALVEVSTAQSQVSLIKINLPRKKSRHDSGTH